MGSRRHGVPLHLASPDRYSISQLEGWVGGRYGNVHIFKSGADIQKGNPAREM